MRQRQSKEEKAFGSQKQEKERDRERERERKAKERTTISISLCEQQRTVLRRKVGKFGKINLAEKLGPAVRGWALHDVRYKRYQHTGAVEGIGDVCVCSSIGCARCTMVCARSMVLIMDADDRIGIMLHRISVPSPISTGVGVALGRVQTVGQRKQREHSQNRSVSLFLTLPSVTFS